MKRFRNLALLICINTLIAVPYSFAAGGDSGGLLGAIGLDPKTVMLQVLGFLVVLLVLWKFVFSRVGGLLDERQNEINSRMEKLETDQQELDRLNAELVNGLMRLKRRDKPRFKPPSMKEIPRDSVSSIKRVKRPLPN